MPQGDEPFATDALQEFSNDELAAQNLVAVRSCGRIGLTANPPAFSLANWFRIAQRR